MSRFSKSSSYILSCVVVVVIRSTPASAGVEQCITIKNELDRLTCYDRESGFTPTTKSIEGPGKWNVSIETSKIDDSKNVFLYIESSEHTNCRYKKEPHILMIACQESTTSLYVTFGGCFMSEGSVIYRLDREPARTIKMTESNDNEALGLWDGESSIPLVKNMIGHSQLLIRATPFSDDTVQAEYEIAGLEEAAKPLREACGW